VRIEAGSVLVLQGGEECPIGFVLQYVDAHQAEVEADDRGQYSSPREQQLGVCSMNGLLVKLAITAAGSLLCSSPIGAQNPPPQKSAEHVEITNGPALEIAHDDLAIIRWTTTNPAGMTIISQSRTTVRIPRI
jgi:hypothetical protein